MNNIIIFLIIYYNLISLFFVESNKFVLVLQLNNNSKFKAKGPCEWTKLFDQLAGQTLHLHQTLTPKDQSDYYRAQHVTENKIQE